RPDGDRADHGGLRPRLPGRRDRRSREPPASRGSLRRPHRPRSDLSRPHPTERLHPYTRQRQEGHTMTEQQMEGTVRLRGWNWWPVALTVAVVSAACSSGADTTTSGPTSSRGPSPTSASRDVMEIEDFGPLAPGEYFLDPD